MAGKRFAHFEVSQGDVTVVRFTTPKLSDDATLNEVRDQLFEFIESQQPAKLLLDFGDVTSCSSLMINCVLRVKKAITRDHGGQLKLHMIKGESEDEGLVYQAFQMLKLDKILDIYHSLDDARAAFA